MRHGESEINRRRVITSVIGGPLDLPLTESGRRQAEQAAVWLAGRGIAHVFSAPARRAQETAALIAGQLGTGVTVLDGLDEVRTGNLEGRGDAQAWAIHAQTLARWYDGDLAARFPGGESFAEALARFEAGLHEIARQYPGDTVAAVTHGAIQLTVVPRLCPAMEQTARTMPNVAISALELTPGGVACRLWASTAHLTPA